MLCQRRAITVSVSSRFVREARLMAKASCQSRWSVGALQMAWKSAKRHMPNTMVWYCSKVHFKESFPLWSTQRSTQVKWSVADLRADNQFYLFLSLTYFVLGCGWAYLCVKNLSELL